MGEMSPDFGIEFYSTEGDTVRVFPGGEVHFKPNNAERSLVVNEQVRYAMGGGEPARARVLSTRRSSSCAQTFVPRRQTFVPRRNPSRTTYAGCTSRIAACAAAAFYQPR